MNQLHTHIYPLPLELPLTPSHPSRSSQSTGLNSLCSTPGFYQGCASSNHTTSYETQMSLHLAISPRDRFSLLPDPEQGVGVVRGEGSNLLSHSACPPVYQPLLNLEARERIFVSFRMFLSLTLRLNPRRH